MDKKILLGLTTTKDSDWREKINDIIKFNITELALFPTCLKLPERKELYKLLEKTAVQSIPHVHLREDMEEWELDLFAGKYQAQAFNIHPDERGVEIFKAGLRYKNEKYYQMIYLENMKAIDDEYFISYLDKCGGICIDFSHWHDQGTIQNNPGYDNFPNLAKQYKVGCSHISAVWKDPIAHIHYISGEEITSYSNHWLRDFSELDYIKNYLEYMPDLISIELENPIAEQIKAKIYLENLIN